jgi:hypothetical protein
LNLEPLTPKILLYYTAFYCLKWISVSTHIQHVTITKSNDLHSDTCSFLQYLFRKMLSSGADGGKSFARRDLLLKIQSEAQKCWEESNVFEADPGNSRPGPGEKFFGNFPYPYMNGLLHLGHAFSLSKLEFGAAYHRLRGSNVLLPFAFHCTGMPIKASADKLAREVQQYGYPPVFPAVEEDVHSEVAENQADQAAVVAPDKFKSKKSKAASDWCTEVSVGDHEGLWSVR